MTGSFKDMTDENSESVEERNTEKRVTIKAPDDHPLGISTCVQVQCTTAGNEWSSKDGLVTACAKPAAESDAVDADAVKADAAEANDIEIQNGEVDYRAGDDVKDEPIDYEEGWEDEIEAAYSGGITIDTKDDDVEPENWEPEIGPPPMDPYLSGPHYFLPADIHATSARQKPPTFHVVEGQFDDVD